MNCPICGKPRMMFQNGTSYTISVPSTQTSIVSLNPEYCQGMCSGIYTLNSSVTLHVEGMSLPVYNFHMEMITDEEKPLEWAEVERQLDDFMAELSKGEP